MSNYSKALHQFCRYIIQTGIYCKGSVSFMSELYGFKFTYSDLTSDKTNRYIILEVKNNGNFLQCYDYGSTYSVDITDKVDELCKRLAMIDINSWDMKRFYEPMDLFPGFYWELYIETDCVKVACGGRHNYPPNCSDFISIMDFLGVKTFE